MYITIHSKRHRGTSVCRDRRHALRLLQSVMPDDIVTRRIVMMLEVADHVTWDGGYAVISEGVRIEE